MLLLASSTSTVVRATSPAEMSLAVEIDGRGVDVGSAGDAVDGEDE
jgi:hypothetical protein